MPSRLDFTTSAYMDIMSTDECRSVLALAEGNDGWDRLVYGSGGEYNTDDGYDLNLAADRFYLPEDEVQWVRERIIYATNDLNNDYFYADWDERMEMLQINRYRDGQEHRTHIDLQSGLQTFRKFVFVVFLNDPTEWEGGKLNVEYGLHKYTLEPKAGRLVVIPSFVAHEVTPVTAGTRYTIISMGHGPRWR